MVAVLLLVREEKKVKPLVVVVVQERTLLMTAAMQLAKDFELVEERLPLRLGLRGAESRVDEQPAARRQPHEIAVDMVEAERKRQRDPAQPFLNDDHA